MKFKTDSCSCPECVGMCKRRPCWPTPHEAEKIIKAGHAKSMMLDYWVGSPKGKPSSPDTFIVGPAIVGYEGDTAPDTPIGRCTLLTEDGRCPLHGTGYKPYEARASSCTSEEGGIHQHVATLWESKKGIEVVKMWRKTVANCDDASRS